MTYEGVQEKKNSTSNDDDFKIDSQNASSNQLLTSNWYCRSHGKFLFYFTDRAICISFLICH